MRLRRITCCLILPAVSLLCGFFACLGVFYVNTQMAQFVIRGQSMEPSFHNNDLIIVQKYTLAYDKPQRGDVIVFHAEDEQNRDFLKRVIGLPGDHIVMNRGEIFINDIQIEEPYIEAVCQRRSCRNRVWDLAENEYFVLGDNRNNSQDSVDFGPIRRDQIVGWAWFRYDDVFDWDVLDRPTYADDLE